MKTNLQHPFLSYTLVFFQLLSIAVLILDFNWLLLPIWAYAVLLLAIILGSCGVISLKIGNFNVVPDPKPECQLVQSGPYRWIRHPMYSSLLMFFIPIVIVNATTINIMSYGALLLTLLLKLHYEEWLLSKKIPAYNEYKKHSYKLIPFIF